MRASRPPLSFLELISRFAAYALPALLVLLLATPVRAGENTSLKPDKYRFQMYERPSQDSQSEDKPGFSGMSQQRESDLMRDFPEPARPPQLFDTYEDKWYNRM